MSATKTSQYKEAMRLIGDVRLIGLADDVEARFALDDAWDGATAFVLRQAAWKFALKSGPLVTGGSPIAGFSNCFTRPADWLRTHALFVVLAGAAGPGIECPIDIREQGINFSANTAGIQIRFVSSDFADPALANNPWPEHFAKLHAAYLAFAIAARINASTGEAARLSTLFASLLPQAVAHDAVPENPWLRFQLSGKFQLGARNVAQMEHWRYALKTIALASADATGTPIAGYAKAFPVPADWICTHALFIPFKGRELPFDVREYEDRWLTDQAKFTVRYTSSTRAFDATLWPDLVRLAILTFLEFEESGEELGQPGYTPPSTKAGATKAALWQSALKIAREQEAVDDHPWFQAQIDGRWLRTTLQTLVAGYWRFAMKNVELLREEVGVQSGVPAPGYPYRYAVPGDWLKTHAAFIAFDGRECPFDLREGPGTDGSMQWSTAAESFVVRYVSSIQGLDATLWPDAFTKAVDACAEYDEDDEDMEEAPAGPAQGREAQQAGAQWQKALADALAIAGEPEDPRWRFQRDGRWLKAVHHELEQGRWRFARKSVVLTADLTRNADDTITGTVVETPLGLGTISPGYSAAFTKPNDWQRTIRFYRELSASGAFPGGGWPGGFLADGFGASDRIDVDFRDEGGLLHANWSPLVLMYLSRDGLDSTKFPELFGDVVQAWLEFEELRTVPGQSGAAAAKHKLYSIALEAAEGKDDSSEWPRINQTGRFVRARFGRGAGGREMGRW